MQEKKEKAKKTTILYMKDLINFPYRIQRQLMFVDKGKTQMHGLKNFMDEYGWWTLMRAALIIIVSLILG